MGEHDHNLILEYRTGTFQARCSCGAWQKDPVSVRLQQVRTLYDRVEDEHAHHVEQMEGLMARV